MKEILESVGGKQEGPKTFAFPTIQDAGKFFSYCLQKKIPVWKINRFGVWRVYLR